MDDNDKPKLRRHPLAPERFLEGERQKWAAIFTVIGLLTMAATAYGFLPNPEPFLQFFLAIGVSFILGASVTAVMNSSKVQTTTASEIMHSDEEQSRKPATESPIKNV